MTESRRVCLSLIGMFSMLAGCQSAGPGGKLLRERDDLADLRAYLCGSFSTAEQAAADPNNFHDIRLCAVPIWVGRSDGPWLYIEQAAAESLGRPYRQRVYQLAKRDDGRFESRVFELPGTPLQFAGGCAHPEKLDAISPDELTPRGGCTVVLSRKSDGCFVGGTEGKGCASSLRGAKYASSVVTLTEAEVRSWDRGYNASDEQVWGATAGGYVFKRTDAKPSK